MNKDKNQPKRRMNYDTKTLGDDFHTKNAWGMQAEEQPAQDFEKIMAEEINQAE